MTPPARTRTFLLFATTIFLSALPAVLDSTDNGEDALASTRWNAGSAECDRLADLSYLNYQPVTRV